MFRSSKSDSEHHSMLMNDSWSQNGNLRVLINTDELGVGRLVDDNGNAKSSITTSLVNDTNINILHFKKYNIFL